MSAATDVEMGPIDNVVWHLGGAIDQPKELAALKEQGALTEEEFAAQKAKILG